MPKHEEGKHINNKGNWKLNPAGCVFLIIVVGAIVGTIIVALLNHIR